MWAIERVRERASLAKGAVYEKALKEEGIGMLETMKGGQCGEIWQGWGAEQDEV